MDLSTNELLAIIAVMLGGGAGVALVAHLLRKLFKLQSGAVIHTMVLALGYIAGVLQYIIQIHSKLPVEILGVSGTAIYGFSQIVYKYIGYAQGYMDKVSANDATQGATTQADAATAVAPLAEPAVSEPVSPAATNEFSA